MTSTTETEAKEYPNPKAAQAARDIADVLREVVLTITGASPRVKLRVASGFALMVIRPAAGMRFVVGSGGNTIKAIQTIAAFVGKKHGLTDFQLTVREPEGDQGDQEREAMAITEADIENTFSWFISKLLNADTRALAVVEGAECLISFPSPPIGIRAEALEVASAMAAGLERNNHMTGVDRYAIT